MVKMNFRKSKGITLVALVITIIVLLILAGVTLNIVLNSGIINKSQTATSKYNEQATKEKLTLALTEYKFKQLAGDSQSLESIIQNIGGEVTETTDTEWTIDLDGYIFTVDKKTNAITNIEPSNAEPLNPPTIGDPIITLAGNGQSAIISVTATPTNGGTLTVTIAGQTITQENGKYTVTVNTNGNIIITVTETVEGRKKTATKTANVTVIPEPSPVSKDTTGDGYVGCYADIDGNGTIDGIIYADLLVRKPTSGNWGTDTYGSYEIPTTVNATNVKDYVISATPVTESKFDSTSRYVIKPASTSTGTQDRFYVMGLENKTDGTNSSLYWYKNARGEMSDYETATSVDFGKGKENTETILAKWKKGSGEGGYGAQDNRDVWKYINTGWFVPSRGEWAAFSNAFNVSSSTYENLGLSSFYWTSSQMAMYGAWEIRYDSNNMSIQNVDDVLYVRLSTTF